jgi:hypothetical protein
MFIYFPEFVYRKTKELTRNSFTNKFNEKSGRDEITKILLAGDIRVRIAELDKLKISLPKIQFEHCVKLGINSYLEPISSYNIVTNKIHICGNLVENNLDEVVRKEFSYFYHLNTTYAGKTLGSNDLAKIALQSCDFSIRRAVKSPLIRQELVRRCGYSELKYKYINEVNRHDGEIDINILTKRLIDQSINSL